MVERTVGWVVEGSMGIRGQAVAVRSVDEVRQGHGYLGPCSTDLGSERAEPIGRWPKPSPLSVICLWTSINTIQPMQVVVSRLNTVKRPLFLF